MIDLPAIEARHAAYLADRTDHILTIVDTAGDVPALVAEVQRLREERDAWQYVALDGSMPDSLQARWCHERVARRLAEVRSADPNSDAKPEGGAER